MNRHLIITGASGLVGSALASTAHAAGYILWKAVRVPPSKLTEHTLFWDVATGRIDLPPDSVNDQLFIVHLAGESIAAGRWTQEQKERIQNSRVDVTRKLSSYLASSHHRPDLFLSASAIGLYGDGGEEELNEQSPAATDFLGKVCAQWEAAAGPLKKVNVPVAHLRFGLILAPEGGALKQMLPVFRLGLGGQLGDGQQWMSWITLKDAVAAILHIIEQKLSGSFNIVTENPVRNCDFTTALAAALHRPAILPVPAFALRMLLGEMADGLLLRSQRVLPRSLAKAGFQPQHPKINQALPSILPG
ncbi:MAG: TIGR01777 family oxidoreductase [Verrucomicrobiota bacterium]|nr:TIGR01777 family oxidoreductase [Verrucomicrobiota bacterium]